MFDNEMGQDELSENVGAGFGSVSWWDLRDTLITPDDLRQKFSDVGLDPDDVADIRATTAVARAAREFKMGRKGKDERRYRAEVVYKDPTRIEVQIQYHTKDDNRQTSWLPYEKVAWDVATSQWDQLGKSDESAVFRSIAEKRMKFYDHVWLRSWLRDQMIGLNGFAVGPNFYTPMNRADETKKVGELVLSIGNSEFYSLNVMDGDQTFRSVSNGARSDIETTLDGLLKKIAKWDTSSRKVRDDSAAQTIADFSELKARADLYADSLRVSLDDLKSAIDVAQSRAGDILDGNAGKQSAKVESPTEEGRADVPSVEPSVEDVEPQPAPEAHYEPFVEPITINEVDALRAEFKRVTGKDAPAIEDIDSLRGLVEMVSGAAL